MKCCRAMKIFPAAIHKNELGQPGGLPVFIILGTGGNMKHTKKNSKNTAVYAAPKVSWSKDFKKNRVLYLLFLPILAWTVLFNICLCQAS